MVVKYQLIVLYFHGQKTLKIWNTWSAFKNFSKSQNSCRKYQLTQNFDLSQYSLRVNNTVKGCHDLLDSHLFICLVIFSGIHHAVSATSNLVSHFISCIDNYLLPSNHKSLLPLQHWIKLLSFCHRHTHCSLRTLLHHFWPIVSVLCLINLTIVLLLLLAVCVIHFWAYSRVFKVCCYFS